MRWLRRALLILAVLSVIAICVAWPLGLRHWLAFETACYNTPGTPHNYNCVSGSGSDLGEVTLIGVAVTALLTWYHKINCHTAGCWRIGKHDKAGGEYSVCRRCHYLIEGLPPRHKLTIEHLREKHHTWTKGAPVADDGMTTCPTCDGTGKIRNETTTCPDCAGDGQVATDEG